jgi:dihydroneopterin aldolase
MYKNPSIKKRSYTGVLHIVDLVVPVNIGVTKEERAKKQDISITLKLHFKEMPKGSETDQINDTVCYHTLCDQISHYVIDKEFNLIEKFSADLCKLIDNTDIFSKIELNIKKTPKIKGLKGCVIMELSAL